MEDGIISTGQFDNIYKSKKVLIFASAILVWKMCYSCNLTMQNEVYIRIFTVAFFIIAKGQCLDDKVNYSTSIESQTIWL